MSNVQELAKQYVDMHNRIKEASNAVAEMRKTLKKMDAVLLVEMAAHNVNEVSVNGVVISRTSRLTAK
jgi:DNA-binding protein YbaB